MDVQTRPLSIACPNFGIEEKGALRSILGLLKPYLGHPWVVSDAGPFDVCFVNVDNPDDAATTLDVASRVVRCALRPKQHPKGTIHRPLRPHEVLAVLSDVTKQLKGSESDDRPHQGGHWGFRLRGWPLDFAKWPKPWWRVLACIARETHSIAQIAERTGLPAKYVEACIERLLAAQLVERLACTPAGVAAGSSLKQKWSALASRFLEKFGLAR
ncbi:MarR family transcriptional regulator [Dyella acidisoli]|uniref:MarR family transcriptional regulator n=1 Tax=Dyella acidisoli TaxID=1867834 RepID=A0ABQ5XQJ2_9GAMM|nr:helix-turn-helix domain-containing protein [Dyella acidisoli]GLQ94025.1 hypothetical protein GCM10007901_29760 [Dyella acidisoli]